MLFDRSIPELVEIVDVGKTHVYTPKSFMFVCGGPYDIESKIPLSFRDLFLRLDASKAFCDASSIIAESLNGAFHLVTMMIC